MKGRVFSYRHETDTVTRKARTVKNPTDVRGAKWAFEFAVRDPATGKRKSISGGGFGGQREAQRALTAKMAEFESSGRRVPTEPSRIALSQFVTEVWLPAVSHNRKRTTIENYEQLHHAYVNPHIGGLPLRDITSATLTGLYSKLAAGGGRKNRSLSPMTVHHVHVLMSTILGYATEAGYLKVNPATTIPKAARRTQPKRSAEKLRYWTPAQANAFRTTTSAERLAPLYLLALNLGLRRGELAGLQWSDLDLESTNAVLHVRRQLVMVGAAVVEQDPKTDRSARTIELGPETVAVLRDHRKRQVAEQLLAGPLWESDGRGWVFTTELGQSLKPTSVTNKLESAARRAKVPWVTLHGLRHTCAVMLLSAGVPLKVVSERLGHTSTSFTADLYQHVIPGMQRNASVVIEQALGMG